MKDTAGWLGWWVIAMCVGACGKSAGNGAVSQQEWPGKVAALQCESLSACCSQQGFAFDTAGCKSLITEQVQEELDDELRPSVAYDAEAAGECLASVRVACGDFVGDNSSACGRILVGSLSPGEACISSTQCRPPEQGSAYCDGVCVASGPAPHGKLGQACSFTCQGDDGECSDSPSVGGAPPLVACYTREGFYCAFGGGAELPDNCQPLVPVGQPCSGTDLCAEDAFCATGGLCTLLFADGAACDVQEQCQSGTCRGSVCGGAPTVEQDDCALN